MKKIFLIGLLLVLINQVVLAQFSSEKELVDKIKSYTDNVSLSMFLMDHNLIERDSVAYFDVEYLKVDVFKKNLFGTTDPEITIQLRDGVHFAVNFFYYEGGKLKKVPGRLSVEYQEGGGYDEQHFSFAYENVFKANEYIVITQEYTGYVRSVTETKAVYRISRDTINQIYSYVPHSSTYSGVMLYNYYTDMKDSFMLVKNTYPKCLVLTGEFNNWNGYRIDEVAEEYSEVNYESDESGPDGSISIGTFIDTIFFVHDTIRKIAFIKKNETCYIGSMQFVPTQREEGCENNTYYITNMFANNYLLEPERPFKELDTSKLGFVQGTCAYITDRKLYITAVNQKTRKKNIYFYPLRPSISALLKDGISPDSLYYWPPHDSNKEGSVRDTGMVYWDDSPVRFASAHYIYTLDLEKKIIIITSSYRPTYAIPLKIIQPYLKPEILQQFMK